MTASTRSSAGFGRAARNVDRKRDGATSRIEVYLFGELASDGRLRRVEEISRIVDGDQADARLARVR